MTWAVSQDSLQERGPSAYYSVIKLEKNSVPLHCLLRIVTLGGLVGPSESNKDGYNWWMLSFLILAFYF